MRKLLFLTPLIIIGCAGIKAKGPLFNGIAKPSDNEAVVYLYKTQHETRSDCVTVRVNQNKENLLCHEGYLEFKLPSGTHFFDVRMTGIGYYNVLPFSQSLDLKPNSHLFAKVSLVKGAKQVSLTGTSNVPVVTSTKFTTTLTPISEDDAIKELSALRLSNE